MNGLISDDFSQEAMQAIGDPHMRRSFADLILQIRDQSVKFSNGPCQLRPAVAAWPAR